ncbi:MAG TPA: hypothetical protein VMF13_19805 [Luteitalea sp.]|nr:hypothetical protein [Luteitalea sp.]
MNESRTRVPAVALLAGLVLLVLLAIGNTAGYRYGVSDQAFYLPSIALAGDPALFPRDDMLLEAQSRLMVTDEMTAALVAAGLPLAPLLLIGHVAALAGLFVSVWLLARHLSASPWTAAACCVAATLRHRITETGANTFEGYYHPRSLAFAAGAGAAVAVIKGRRAWAAGFIAIALILHPTTGAWWAIWAVVAVTMAAAIDRRDRDPSHAWTPGLPVAIAVVVALAGVALVVILGVQRLRPMDDAWVKAFAAKDYVFPNAWPVEAWLANLILPVVVTLVWRDRRRRGLATATEAGLVAGVWALVSLFLVSLPFIASRIALAVQLQTSRVFWVIDLFAVIWMAWWLAEGRLRNQTETAAATSTGTWQAWRPRVLAFVLLAASFGRGVHGLAVEHPERAFVQRGLENSDWVRTGAWLDAHTPRETHVLADPDHDWKFGHSVRIVARRDVLVEGVKDAAVALYDRQVALQVRERLEAVGDFGSLTADKAKALGKRFDLDVLVIDRDLPLPELHRDGRFRVYRLP